MVADILEASIEIYQEYESRAAFYPCSNGTPAAWRGANHSRAGYESYMADLERIVHRALLVDVHVNQRILEVHHV